MMKLLYKDKEVTSRNKKTLKFNIIAVWVSTIVLSLQALGAKGVNSFIEVSIITVISSIIASVFYILKMNSRIKGLLINLSILFGCLYLAKVQGGIESGFLIFLSHLFLI